MRKCREAGFRLPVMESVVNQVAVETGCARAAVQETIRQLRAQESLFVVAEDLLVSEDILTIVKQLLAQRYRAGERFTVSEFKESFGLTRKLAIPLLELLDARGVTLRQENQRLYRGQK